MVGWNPSFDTRLSFELAFQCPWSEFNQHSVANVMTVFLKGGQSTPSSLADGRAGSTTRPARRMAELDRSHDQLDHLPSWTSTALRMALLDRPCDQLSHPPSWTTPVRRMAELNDHAVLVQSAKLLPRNLIKLALDSLWSEAPLELYDFKTARTSFLVWSSDLSYETAMVNWTPWTA